MRPFYFIILCSLLIAGRACQSNHPSDPINVTRTKTDLLKDFSIFRELLETAHPSLNSYLSKNRLNFLLDSLQSTIKEGISIRDFYNKLFFFTNNIGCSHTDLSLPSSIIDTLYNRSLFFPLPVTLINNRLFVNSDNLASTPHGTEILSINHMPVQSVLNELAFYNPVDGLSRSTQKELACSEFGLQFYKRYGGNIEFEVEIKDTLGRLLNRVLPATTLEELRNRESSVYYSDATDVSYRMHVVEEKHFAIMRIVTFNFGSDNNEFAFEDFVKNSFELLTHKPDCKTLIIDLRENTGGYLYWCFYLFSYLTTDSFMDYKSVSSRVEEIPLQHYLSADFPSTKITDINDRLKNEFTRLAAFDYLYLDSLKTKWLPNKNRFHGNVFVITNAKVMSAASYLCTLIKNSGRGYIVGVEIGGSDFACNGFETLDYELPNSGIMLSFPYAHIDFTLGSPKSGRGLLPNYIVPDDSSSFMKNSDTQNNYIVDSLIKKTK